MRKEERLAPVYTLCLYHGAEEWDGPRSLKDMMDFGEEGPGHGEREVWEKCFADYPMSLVCVNELPDCSGFQTSLRELFTILPYRGDKRRLKELLDRNSVYQKMDEETAQTIGVLMGIKKLMENREKYKTEEGEYNVCHAINEMMEDSRLEGIVEGEARGKAVGMAEGEARGKAEGSVSQIIEIIENIMRELHCSLERACKVAGKTLAEYHQAKLICPKA